MYSGNEVLNFSIKNRPDALDVVSKISRLGLYNDDTLAALVGWASIDPCHFISTLRTIRKTLDIQSENQIFGDTVVFNCGKPHQGIPEVAIHVNIFSNDLIIGYRDDHKKVSEYVEFSRLCGQELYNKLLRGQDDLPLKLFEQTLRNEITAAKTRARLDK